MSFETVTPTQKQQHEQWKEVRKRLRAPETKVVPIRVAAPPVLTVVESDPRFEMMDFCIAAVANVAGLPVNEVLSGIPTAEVRNARNLAMALCRSRFNLPRELVSSYFEVHQKAVSNSAQVLDTILIDLSISSRTPLEMILTYVWPLWVGGASRPTVREIQDAVCEVWGITRMDLLSERRKLTVVRPRHSAMALAKHLTIKSLPEIGREFAGKDHTTILHAVHRYSPVIKAAVERVGNLSTPKQWAVAIYDQLPLTALAPPKYRPKARV